MDGVRQLWKSAISSFRRDVTRPAFIRRIIAALKHAKEIEKEGIAAVAREAGVTSSIQSCR